MPRSIGFLSTLRNPQHMWNGWFAAKKPPDLKGKGKSTSPIPPEEDGDKVAEEEPVHFTKSKAHHVGNGTYVNPWPSAKPGGSGGWIPSFQIPFAWAQVLHPSLKRKSKTLYV